MSFTTYRPISVGLRLIRLFSFFISSSERLKTTQLVSQLLEPILLGISEKWAPLEPFSWWLQAKTVKSSFVVCLLVSSAALIFSLRANMNFFLFSPRGAIHKRFLTYSHSCCLRRRFFSAHIGQLLRFSRSSTDFWQNENAAHDVRMFFFLIPCVVWSVESYIGTMKSYDAP